MYKKVADTSGTSKTHTLVPTSDPDATPPPTVEQPRDSRARVRGSGAGSVDTARLAHDSASARLHFARQQGKKRRMAICKHPIIGEEEADNKSLEVKSVW